jgi:hypothetical protein
MAYGNVKNHGEANLAEKQKIAMDFFVGSKITLDWPELYTDASGVSISLKMARLIYNMLIIASSALIRGGVISVRISADAEARKIIEVFAKAPHKDGGSNLKWDVEIEKILLAETSSNELNSKNVQLHLTRYYADDLRATIEIKTNADELVLLVTQPAGDQ